MAVDIRPVRDDELPAYVDTLSTGFLERPDIEAIVTQVRTHWDLSRTWAAVDDGRICGTFRSWRTELTVPGGGRIAAAAVAAVSVLPTHRRQGLLRRLVDAEHAAARARGEAVALLYASEYPIYGRFGYGPAVEVATWTLETRAARFRESADGGSGSVELVPANEASRELLKAVFEQRRATATGEIRRREFTWDIALGLAASPWGERWKGFLAVRRDAAGTPDGYVRYHAEDKWEQRQPRNTLVVDELHALGDEAYLALWRDVAEMDWVGTGRAEHRSSGERLRWWLTTARAAVPSEVGDGLWVRLLDVPAALAARRYERDGRVVLDVLDDDLPGGSGRHALEVVEGAATCTPTDEPPDLVVPVAALGSAYLGGVGLRDVTIALGGREERPGALAEADAIFRTRDAPWCSTFF